MQEISAYVTRKEFSATATGELTDEYIDESLHICILSNLSVKASKIAFLYREAGEGFVENVPPETAFILHDKHLLRTIFGTDQFAVKPLFYSLQSGKLMVHSNLNDLLFFSENKEVNVRKTVDYFKWESDDLPADNQTFYKDIFRLLPAQTGFFSDNTLTFDSKDTLSEKTPLLTGNEVVQNFRTAFEDSVAMRKVNRPAAANLSGGLDSSSVVGVLSSQTNRKLTTIYFDAQKSEADERKFAKCVAEKHQTDHREVTAPKSLFGSLISVTEKIAQPDPGILPSFIHEVVFEEIERENINYLYSGHGGDNITGYGLEFLDDLFRSKQWGSLKKQAKKYDDLRFNDESISGTLFKREIKRAVQQKAFFQAVKLGFICLFYFGIVPLPIMYNPFRKRIRIPDYKRIESRLLKIKASVGLKEHQTFILSNLPDSFTKDQRKHLDFAYIRLAINGNETLTTLGHYRDTGVSFPFFDRELLGVSVQATNQQKFGDGHLRGTLRNALNDYLPEKVKTRVSKADFTSAALMYFGLLYEDFRREFPLDHDLWRIVDAHVFQEIVDVIEDEQFTPQQKVKHTWLAMRVINFGIFLNTVG